MLWQKTFLFEINSKQINHTNQRPIATHEWHVERQVRTVVSSKLNNDVFDHHTSQPETLKLPKNTALYRSRKRVKENFSSYINHSINTDRD